MRIGIVKKLFLLTTGLCLFILFIIFLGQTLFFKQYYVNRKVNDIKTHIDAFQESYLKNRRDINSVQRMEQDFYREHNTWITLLDSNGNIKYAEDFYIEVELELIKRMEDSTQEQSRTMKIPLYFLVSVEELPQSNEDWSDLIGAEIYTFGIEAIDDFIPVSISFSHFYLGEGNVSVVPASWENKVLSKRIEGDKFSYVSGRGTIKNIRLPDMRQASTWIYENPLFLEMIQEFQGDILLDEEIEPGSLNSFDYERNEVKYKVFIEPIIESDGTITYIFAMTSLQPVDEAMQMIQGYYIYVVLVVLLLTLLVSLYYSERIVKPLLNINKVTKQIVDLDFSEKIKNESKDEIGDLSRNINQLSDTLHAHIEQLQQDIEKERALETTRKEFISNVSHELKTPLSVMKSCVSILKDGVAPQKRDYYFQAMENEVDKMNLLIVDMLELAKLESGTYKMELNEFYIDKIFESVVEKLLPEIDKKELQLEIQLLAIQVHANQRYMEQVIINFVTNAIAYTPSKEKLIVSMTSEMDQVMISIENKGAHIPNEQLGKVWDQFYRGDSARKRSQGGTGLGLAISRNILELHKTDYGVRNTKDGVLFYFYVPVKK